MLFLATAPPLAAILIYYIFFVSVFSTKRTAFRNTITSLHSLPGLVLGVVGVGLCLLLGSYLCFSNDDAYFASGQINASSASAGNRNLPPHQQQQQHPPCWFWDEDWFWGWVAVWIFAFLANTLTGFVMIPQLPNCDPSTKREFMTLVCCQLSFLPAILGMLDFGKLSWWLPCMQLCCYSVSALGLVVSSANFVLYLLDYCEGKSQQVCSGKYLVDQMDKQHEIRQQHDNKRSISDRTKTLLQDYVSICFMRGSEKTRMPANKLMIFIGLTLIVPFPIIALIGYRLVALKESYYGSSPSLMALPALLEVVMLCTVGNMQVFHGTLSVRGKVTVTSASVWVAFTTVLELILIGLVNDQALGGWENTKDYLYCILSGVCRAQQ